MRILIVHPGPDFSVADVFHGYARGFAELGHQVEGFNLNDRLSFYTSGRFGPSSEELSIEQAVTLVNKGLEAKCYEFWPDLIVVISGFFVNEFTWRLWNHRNHKVVTVFTESPYEDDKQLELVEYAEPDLVVVNDPTNLEQFTARQPNTIYLPHAYRPDVHRPDPTVPKSVDFTFVGTGYPSRVAFFEQVPWGGLTARFAGLWKSLSDESPLRRFLVSAPDECSNNADTVRLYQQADVSANLYRAGSGYETVEANAASLAAGWAVGPREIELAATGTFFLREPRGEGDVLFPMLPTFSDPDEFGSLLRWWLAHDDERIQAAAQARAAVADRTFRNNAQQLLKRLF